MEFKNSWLLLFIPVLAAGIITFLKRYKTPTIRFSSLRFFEQISDSWKIFFSRQRILFRLAAIVLLVIALAGPRKVLEKTQVITEGIDIVLAVDSSGSMAAEDFSINNQRRNRLDVVKEVVREFIEQRKADRIGLVAFAGLAFTVCPLTTDYDWLKVNLERVHLGLIEDGTAIGSGISSSLTRLKDSQARSKIIVLLTDGVNNAGKVDPLTAARAAQALKIKIYTIGAGAEGFAPFPVQGPWGQTMYQDVRIDIDEKVLREIADLTGGKYFRATDTESLRNVYKEIDSLEKTRIEQAGYKEYKELFAWFLLAGLGILLVESVLFNTVLLKIP